MQQLTFPLNFVCGNFKDWDGCKQFFITTTKVHISTPPFFKSSVVSSAFAAFQQVYNERISRLSLEAKQARHRADAAMRKLRELVKACKEQDLNTISTLAVQVDTDSIASPYSEKPQWEQQASEKKRFQAKLWLIGD